MPMNIRYVCRRRGRGFAIFLPHGCPIWSPATRHYRTREFPRLFQGGAYPPNTLLMIDRLVREEFLIEVSAVAAL